MSFSGKTDEPKSHGSRSKGLTLAISAKSADHVGKGKEKKQRQKDNTTFGAVAQQWGTEAGYQVKVDSSLSSIQRAYWAMHNESFHNWGRRIAKELGATFKIAYPNAAFVPRNSGTSASGQQLSPLIVVAPGNLISWEITPIQGRGLYANSRAFYYDPAAALYKVVSQATGLSAAQSDLTDGHKHADQDHATNKAKSNAADSQRKSGGGSIELYGDPRAMSQNNCQLSGARAGVDGSYRIKTARHTLTRGGGWKISVDVEQPQGAAGTDSR